MSPFETETTDQEEAMIALIFAALINVAPAPAAPACEVHGPRLDGTYVTVCAGSVVAVSDGQGNVNVRPFSSR